MANLIGQTIGSYEILALLGEGGMASVYRARQTTMRRDVAIKVIKTGLNNAEQFMLRFEREAQTVAALNHPHILKVFDYGQQDDLAYLVMELQPGGSLADLIKKGPIPASRTSRLLEQVASALDYAHRHGIVHRDLKPQNILLDPDGNAILTDFGIAKLLNDTNGLTQSGVAIGTPTYMAPEQWQGLPIDARTDLYALGVVTFEMLSGLLPFQGDTPFSVMHKHIYDTPPSIVGYRPEIPFSVDQVLKKALAKDREQRYNTALEFVEAFKAALANPVRTGPDTVMQTAPLPKAPSTQQTIPPTAPPTAPPTPPPAPRAPDGRIAIVLAVIVLVVIAGFYAANRPVAAPTTPTAVAVVPSKALPTKASTTAAPPTNPPSTINADATQTAQAQAAALVSTQVFKTVQAKNTTDFQTAAAQKPTLTNVPPTLAPTTSVQPTVIPATTIVPTTNVLPPTLALPTLVPPTLVAPTLVPPTLVQPTKAPTTKAAITATTAATLAPATAAPTKPPTVAPTLAPATVPTIAVDQAAIGAVTFSGQNKNLFSNSLTLKVTNISLPDEGKQYIVWLWDRVKTPVNIGRLSVRADSTAQLTYNEPRGQNLLGLYSVVFITMQGKETTPTGKTLYSGAIPAQANVHIQHVLARFPETPNKVGLMVGALKQQSIMNDHVVLLDQAQKQGSVALIRLHLEHIHNILTGTEGALDINGDGQKTIIPPGDGFGIFNYLTMAAQHATLTLQQPDVTDAIKGHINTFNTILSHTSTLYTHMEATIADAVGKTTLADLKPIAQQVITLNTAAQTGETQDVPAPAGLNKAYPEALAMADIPIRAGDGAMLLANGTEPTMPAMVATDAPTVSPTAAVPVSGAVTVQLQDEKFSPAAITVKAGQSIVFVNADPMEHTATADDGSFDTGVIAPGATSKPIVISKPGTYAIYCQYHGGPGGVGMAAVITVQ